MKENFMCIEWKYNSKNTIKTTTSNSTGMNSTEEIEVPSTDS